MMLSQCGIEGSVSMYREYAMKTMLMRCRILVLLIAALPLGGCGSCRKIHVTAMDEVCKKSVELHLVGVNRFEKDTWHNMSVNEYWQPGSPWHEDAKGYTYKIQYGGQQPCKITIPPNDPIAKIWKDRNAEHLFILGDLHGIFEDKPGNADPRRLMIPAPCSKEWKRKTKTIEIVVTNSNIRCDTTPK